MERPIITINNLGKRYLLGLGGGERYRALRDVMANSVRNLLKINTKNGDPQEIWALKGITFDIRKGEKVGIIGRNGAGKTTLLKILSEITEPTEGEAHIYGRVASLLEVGTGFHPELTGKENIFMNAAILGMTRAEIKKKFDEIVSFAEIEKFLDTPVKRYSSGMYVRLAFAVAAHLEPEILIVDEVLAVGDIVFQKKCLGKMSEVAKGGRTVIFVSHNMDAVRKLCERTVILKGGAKIAEGPTEEVIRKYQGQLSGIIGERIWEDISKAPGGDVVRMYAMRVLDRKGEVSTNFDVRDPISIEIEYKVLEEGHHLVSQFCFINEMRHLLFYTKDNLDSPWRDCSHPTGYYRSICNIPGDFFNEGSIFVSFGIDEPERMHSTARATMLDVVGFMVSDKMDPEGVRGNYEWRWSKYGLRPRMKWEVTEE